MVEAVAEVVKPAAGIEFLARKAIHVGKRQTSALADGVAVGIISVLRRQSLTTSHQAGDVPVAVRVVVAVRVPIGTASRQTANHTKEAANLIVVHPTFRVIGGFRGQGHGSGDGSTPAPALRQGAAKDYPGPTHQNEGELWD